MAPPDAPDGWADLVQLGVNPQPISTVSVRRAAPKQPRNWRALPYFLLLVVLPTLLSGLYFGMVAPDRYLAEAKFIVRKPGAPGMAAAITPSSPEQTLQTGDEDAYAVREFLLSRDAMRLMVDHAGLRQLIARSGWDPLWRFPGPITGKTDEEMYDYYLDLVSVVHEATTGVSTLRVQAFDPEDARRIADALTDAGEVLLNQLQVRARQDAIKVAAGEVDRTRALATAAQNALTDFRKRESVVDPTMLAQTVLSTITALSLQVVDAGAQLDLLQHASANSPQLPPLRSRVAALQAQIDRERASLAGTDASFAPKIAEYERLVLLRDFAVRNFISAMTALETARIDALHQRVYLERVVKPHAADQAAYPYRIISVLIVFGVGLLAYRLLRPEPAIRPSVRAQFV